MRSTAWKFAGWPPTSPFSKNDPSSPLLFGGDHEMRDLEISPAGVGRRSGWMQTNFLWTSHEHLIFVQRAVKSWIEMSHRSNSFGRIALPARRRGGRMAKMKKAQLRVRSCNGIHSASRIVAQLRNFNIFSFAWIKNFEYLFYGTMKERQEIRQMFNAYSFFMIVQKKEYKIFCHATRRHLIHFTFSLLYNQPKIIYRGKARISN